MLDTPKEHRIQIFEEGYEGNGEGSKYQALAVKDLKGRDNSPVSCLCPINHQHLQILLLTRSMCYSHKA